MAILVKKNKGNSFFPSFSNIMDDFFQDDFFGRGFVSKPTQALRRSAHTLMPAVNVLEDEHAFHLELAAPGLKKEHFAIELNNNILSIAFEQNSSAEGEEGSQYIRREFSSSSFKRSFALPEDAVDSEQIEASYQDGILRLQLPKRKKEEQERKKLISVS